MAIGQPTESRLLQRRLAAANGPRAVFTWVEALGIGGHALASAPRGEPGCYDCLFSKNGAPYARSDFAAEGQDLTARLAGCSSSFTPYSYLDALRTAELAARLATKVLLGEEPEATLISRKGDAAKFITQGYKTSERFNAAGPEVIVRGEALANTDCTTCGRAAA